MNAVIVIGPMLHRVAAALGDVRKIGRFIGVGGVGSLVDSILYFAAQEFLGLFFLAAKLVATPIAVVATFALNRSYTFRDRAAGPVGLAFLRYALTSSVGASINVATLSLVAPFDAAYHHVPAYVAGTAAGLITNYLLCDLLVFAQRRDAGRQFR